MKNPDLFNRRAVMQRFLKQIKVPGINELMTDVPSPEKRMRQRECGHGDQGRRRLPS
jgi:hypothetical protein